MTSSTTPATALNQPAATGTRVPRLTFGGVLKSERIKLGSLRSVRVTLLITLLASVSLSVLFAFASLSMFETEGAEVAAFPAEQLQQYLLSVSTFASPFLALIFGVLGVFAMSSEYSSGMILASLAAVPRRPQMYLGKALVLAAIAAVTAFTLIVLGLAIGPLFLPIAATELFSGAVLSGALGTIFYLVCVTLFGFGVAAMLRSTAGGITIVASVIFVLPIAMQILSITGWDWVSTVLNYLPMQLGSVLATGVLATSTNPTFWGALVAIALWAVVPLAAGLAALQRRDAR